MPCIVLYYKLIFSSGSQEVMGDLEALVDDHPHPEDPAPVPPVDPFPGDHPAQEHRPSIDNMIQQLQREQDQRIAREGLESLGSPPPQLGSPRVNRANSGRCYLHWLKVGKNKIFSSLSYIVQ